MPLVAEAYVLAIAILMEGPNGAGRVNAKVDQQFRAVADNPATYLT